MCMPAASMALRIWWVVVHLVVFEVVDNRGRTDVNTGLVHIQRRILVAFCNRYACYHLSDLVSAGLWAECRCSSHLSVPFAFDVANDSYVVNGDCSRISYVGFNATKSADTRLAKRVCWMSYCCLLKDSSCFGR
jgi:hypothetical protein